MALTFREVQQLVDGGDWQEGLHVEFKRGATLLRENFNRQEFVKDITGFANADGGALIYGIAEGKSESITVATGIEAVGNYSTHHSRDSLIQILRANSSPYPENIDIYEIAVPDGAGGGRLVVFDVPPSTTAHQNLQGKQYWQRAGTNVETMAHHQIVDVMNRRAVPRVKIDLQQQQISTGASHLYGFSPRLSNLGNVLLERWTLELDFPVTTIRSTQPLDYSSPNVIRENVEDDSGELVCRVTTSDPSPTGSRILVHPARKVDLTRVMGFPQIKVTVDQSNYKKMFETKPSIFARLYLPSAQPIFEELKFDDWCSLPRDIVM